MSEDKMVKTKYIFVTGGVISGLGKGVSAASLGRLLKSRGFKVFAQKFDPYYNIDPGTMNPYQHGEVFVTIDGGETDLDLGHYERFIGENFSKESNYVQGSILQELLEEERQGKYDGNTIQVVPHVTNKIINKILEVGKISKADFVITEIGGTVGDIESHPFVFAISQFSRKFPNSSFFLHATYIPYLETSEEFKSKPTQNSLTTLQSLGIFPNMLLLRANRKMTQNIVTKIAKKANLEKEKCIPVPNSDNVYKVPLYFEEYQMAQQILKFFKMKNKKPDLSDWQKYVSLLDAPKNKEIVIGMLGKYIEYEDAYKSIVEALKISGNWNQVKITLKWIQVENINIKKLEKEMINVDGIIILPGFGPRGFEGKILTAKYSRDNDIPTLGICYGMQAMTIVQARIMGIKNANSSEAAEKGTHVIDIIRNKKKNDKIGGTLRLGLSETKMKPGSIVQKLYKTKSSFERHRHRYEVNPNFVKKIENKEFIFSGFDAKTKLAEVCEMPNKKFYVGLQAHPEFNARPLKEHPVFKGFIKAIIKNN